MRQCYIHVGTHKTGTKSLQYFLNHHRLELEAQGICYPQAGRPALAPDGHHNLAWEISGDRRFSTDYGDSKSLFREIEGSSLDVIISSEDFECSVHHADRFGKFIAQFQSLGIRTNLVVYLRNQIDYAESLYFTLALLGLDRSFSDYCDEILETNAFRWREWIFPFRYDTFLAQLASFAGVEVIVRSFDAAAIESPIVDFLSILGLDIASISLKPLPWHNRRQDLIGIAAQFHANQMPPTLSLARQNQFAKAFGESNRTVYETYRLPDFERMRQDRLIAPDASNASLVQTVK